MPVVQTFAGRVIDNVEKVIVGKRAAIELLLVALLTEGHVLLEDVPGVGKTMLARAMAISLGGAFKRLQCTPDLLPNDVTGVSVFNQQTAQFEFRPGPIFVNILLADEINRATPRTQSALLEAMQERTLTVDGVTHALPEPFLVIATQNPSSFTGTFPLPEAQLDRFGVSVSIGFPSPDDELMILDTFRESPHRGNETVASAAEILSLQSKVKRIHAADEVRGYMVQIIQRSRHQRELRSGLSPRAALHLLYASQGRAFLRGRDFVTPEDVMHCAPIVLPHRMALSPEAKFGGKTAHGVLEAMISDLKVPAGV